VIAGDVDFVTVVSNETPQVFQADSPLWIVIGTLAGELRDRVCVCKSRRKD